SAGSMVMTPRIGDDFVEWPSAPDDRTLGVVDFSIFPHLNLFPTNTPADAQRWAADIGITSAPHDGFPADPVAQREPFLDRRGHPARVQVGDDNNVAGGA